MKHFFVLLSLLTLIFSHAQVEIEHALGTATLDEPATRVVALEWTYIEALLALGVQPVGVADLEGYTNWVDIPVALDESVSVVGTRQEPNLEQIAALEPDLILAPSFRATNNYDELNAVAPTLAFDSYPTDESVTQYDEMLATFRTIARAVGRVAEAEQMLSELGAAFSEAAQRLEARPFVLAQAFTSSDSPTVRLFTENALAVQVLERAGLDNAWQDGFQQYGFSTVGVEGLGDIAEETAFLYVVQDDDNIFEAETVSPVWQSLPFVAANNAHSLGAETWLFGGPLSAMRLLEDVVAALN